MDEGLARLESYWQLFWRWGIIALMLVAGDLLGWLAWPKGFLERGALVVGESMEAVVWHTSAPIRTYQFWQEGMGKIETLEAKNARLALEVVRLREVAQFEPEWQKMTSLQETLVGAGAVAGTLSGRGERLVVSAGDLAGVVSGMVVVDANGVLVGRIIKVGRYTGLIEQPQALNGVMAAKISGRETKGIVVGDGGSAYLTEVLSSEELEVGDLVVTDGTDEKYPPNIVIGEIAEISATAADVTKRALVTLTATPRGLVWVF